MKKTFSIIDKTSEYFRICPYCKVEFMASHMSRDYCSDTCGDMYNNRLKRLRKSYNSLNVSNAYYPLNQIPNVQNDFNTQLQLNISLLDKIWNPASKVTFRSINFLDSIGLDFTVFESKTKLDELRSEIKMGPYILKRQELETIKIERSNSKTKTICHNNQHNKH